MVHQIVVIDIVTHQLMESVHTVIYFIQISQIAQETLQHPNTPQPHPQNHHRRCANIRKI